MPLLPHNIGLKMIDLQQPQAFLAEMPSISQPTLYTCLAEGVGNVKVQWHFMHLCRVIFHRSWMEVILVTLSQSSIIQLNSE